MLTPKQAWFPTLFLLNLIFTLLTSACGNTIDVTLAPEQPPEAGADAYAGSNWRTDFARASVPLGEIQTGGPRRDAIPPIDQPVFVTTDEASAWLKANEPVAVVELGQESRAYPLQILMWHEIVNDLIGDVPISLTYSPLSGYVSAFDRRLEGALLDFGTTGTLRRGNAVMWDRQTESWWQEADGRGLVGTLAGKQLARLPVSTVSFAELQHVYPEALVLSRDTGWKRNYGRNPYVGYDDSRSLPFLFKGPFDGRLQAMDRVVGLSLNNEAVAYPFTLLVEMGAISDTIAGQPIVVIFSSGTASALDRNDIGDGRDVGSAAVYRPIVDGRTLSFSGQNGTLLDRETGSEWSVLGRARSGPLAGRQLEPVVHQEPFWFAWYAFQSGTRVWGH